MNDEYQEVSLAETSRLLAKHLAQRWPDVTFQRKAERWSGGNGITLKWTDGPTEEEVSAVTRYYHGREFDESAAAYLSPSGKGNGTKLYLTHLLNNGKIPSWINQ